MCASRDLYPSSPEMPGQIANRLSSLRTQGPITLASTVSEGIHSTAETTGHGVWVPAFAGTTGGYTSAFSRRHPPEFCKIHPPKTRAQGRPGARCTRGLMCKDALGKNAHEHTGSAEAVRPSLRNGFTAYIVLSPARPGLFVTVVPKKREPPENSTPATGASGPHDFAVRLTRCSSKAHRRPPLPAPTFVTIAKRPSSRARDGEE